MTSWVLNTVGLLATTIGALIVFLHLHRTSRVSDNASFTDAAASARDRRLLMITMGLMILSPILAQTELMMRLLSSETSRAIWRTLYYTLPKVYDVGRMTLNLARRLPVDSWMPIWSSALFAAIVLSAALVIFSRRDF